MTNSSRSADQARAVAHGLAFATMAVFLIIAGLLGMHTLSLGHDMGGGMSASASSAIMADDEPMAAAADTSPHVLAGSDGMDAADSGASGSLSPDPMQTMACILALMAAVLLPLAPLLLAWLGDARPPSLSRARAALAALALPPPPSLHVLSISRT